MPEETPAPSLACMEALAALAIDPKGRVSYLLEWRTGAAKTRLSSSQHLGNEEEECGKNKSLHWEHMG